MTLETMSARLVEPAMLTVSLLGTQTDASTIAADPVMSSKIRDTLAAYAQFLA